MASLIFELLTSTPAASSFSMYSTLILKDAWLEAEAAFTTNFKSAYWPASWASSGTSPRTGQAVQVEFYADRLTLRRLQPLVVPVLLDLSPQSFQMLALENLLRVRTRIRFVVDVPVVL